MRYKIKRKKAFTLIELMISLSIMVMITSITTVSIKGFINYKIRLTNEICKSEIHMFISMAQMYCYSKCREGKIRVDAKENKLLFIYRSNTIDSYSLKSKVLAEGGFSNNEFDINFSGRIKKSGNITFKDEKKVDNIITIHVGTGYLDEN
ncbi:type II secretion system protein [Clostridium polynesiense]|uniref:type II secretion system protein n=1 Tax=Clostridium polynesiense TaxID=1325933 RepID=UPI00058B2A6B|nr:type II secretion system protein [Clostridium polynesiense]